MGSEGEGDEGSSMLGMPSWPWPLTGMLSCFLPGNYLNFTG